MWPQAIRHYRCPACRAALRSNAADPAAQTSIIEATLACSGCGAAYPVKNGIPRFVPPDNYAESFGYQWNLHRNTQLDSVTGLPISRNRLFEVSGWPRALPAQRILEAGSGAGRFTEVLLSTGAAVFSFDYSSAVEANFTNNGTHANLNLFQGDIFNIPLQPAGFDKVICLGVLQHTPDPPAAFDALAAQVRPGGELVIDVYTRSLVASLQWKYLLRPLTRRMDQRKLYRLVSAVVPALVPVTAWLRRHAGRIGARLSPIVEYSQLGLSAATNLQWAVLDTFDMYSPAHDHPQSLATVKLWFEHAGFEHIEVRYGPNGVVGKGRKPGAETMTPAAS
jgi:SAM-dependent methyltransferase